MSHGGLAILLASSWLLFAPGCAETPPADREIAEGEQAFVSGTGPTRGHEDITRFAVEFSNQQLAGELGVSSLFSPIPEGEPCIGTTIPLLQGNCATDSPDDTMTSHYGVAASAWQTAPELQILHFLRNYVGATEVQSARQACEDALALLVAASHLAAQAWAAADTAGGAYWFGHALHIVQDSFAPPHTDRSSLFLRQLDDVCSYGRQVTGVCFHPLVALDDRIWLETLECSLSTARPWDCLTLEAQYAAFASAGYLRVVGRHVHDPSSDLDAALRTWMNGGATDDYVDYFHCEALRDGATDAGSDVLDAAPDVLDAAPDVLDAAPDVLDAAPESPDSGGPDSPDAGVPAADAAVSDHGGDDGGCGCRAAHDATSLRSGWLAGLALVLLGVRRRPRYRRGRTISRFRATTAAQQPYVTRAIATISRPARQK